MAAEAIDIAPIAPDVLQHVVDGLRQLRFYEGRNGPVEHDGEARILDPPAHDIKRVRPHSFVGPGPPIHIVPLILFFLLQLGRVWVIATLGERWTTRIIVLPGAPLVTSGPYRWVKHPNYLVVIGEFAILPLVFGLPMVAIVFSLLNAAMLYVRIRAENQALETLRR